MTEENLLPSLIEGVGARNVCLISCYPPFLCTGLFVLFLISLDFIEFPVIFVDIVPHLSKLLMSCWVIEMLWISVLEDWPLFRGKGFFAVVRSTLLSY